MTLYPLSAGIFTDFELRLLEGVYAYKNKFFPFSLWKPPVTPKSMRFTKATSMSTQNQSETPRSKYNYYTIQLELSSRVF